MLGVASTDTPYKPVRSTMALMKIVSSLRYGLLPASLASGQKSGQPLAIFISLIGCWKEVEVTSGRKASIMCSLLFWSKSIRVTWRRRHRRGHRFVLCSLLLWFNNGSEDHLEAFLPSGWMAIWAVHRTFLSSRRRTVRDVFLALSHRRSNTTSDTFCIRICWSKMLWGRKTGARM